MILVLLCPHLRIRQLLFLKHYSKLLPGLTREADRQAASKVDRAAE